MSLSEIMGASGLAGYAIAGLLIFLVVFLVIALRLMIQSHRGKLDELSSLPLEDGVPAGASGKQPAGGEGRISEHGPGFVEEESEAQASKTRR